MELIADTTNQTKLLTSVNQTLTADTLFGKYTVKEVIQYFAGVAVILTEEDKTLWVRIEALKIEK